ncbi:hypothetical protein DVH05_020528 [Phytophthora capsici]|nr:hypothetical protein DVH05_020528 [Phytophthora capsici]
MALLEVSEDVAAVDADRWAAMDMDGACDGCVVRGWIEMALLEFSEDVAAVDADKWAAMDMDGSASVLCVVC